MNKYRKVALITGGARGIGRAICENLSAQDYDLHISYHKSKTQFEEFKESLSGQNVSSSVGDISDPEVCIRIITECYEHHGRIDSIILNAGTFKMGGLDDLSGDEWRKLIGTNLSSAVYLLKSGLPYIRATGGNIVFIGTGSLSSPTPAPEYPLYEASKSGLLVLMKSLSVSEAEHGVRVNMASPGMIETDNYSKKFKDKISSQIPLGRLGEPSDVANAVAWLISDDASYVTGVNLDVSGGWRRQ